MNLNIIAELLMSRPNFSQAELQRPSHVVVDHLKMPAGVVTALETKLSVRTDLTNIFKTMSYNETEVENFSRILNWLSKNNDMLGSLVDGKFLVGSNILFKFNVEQKVVSVACLDAKSLESILSTVKSQGVGSPKGPRDDDKRSTERFEKFKALMKPLIADLCVLESIACGVPTWQIEEYDSPTWKAESSRSYQLSPSDVRGVMYQQWKANKTVHVLLRISKQRYCLRDILPLIIAAIQSDGKLMLTISPISVQDASLLLPVACLIDAVNKSGILSSPVDLLLLDSEIATLGLLFKSPLVGELFCCGPIKHFPSTSRLMTAGVIKPRQPPSIHFIVDSSADLQTSIHCISKETWCSGTRVNLRARSLLFVHQPVYATVIELLEKKLASLRINKDTSRISSDFITRAVSVSIDLKKVLAQGVHVLPQSSDLSVPTVVYEIGTSSDLIANRVPGLGHILCVIPYRSNAELLSLANNHGGNVQSQIHASNSDIIKTLCRSIQADEIWVNSSGKYNGEEGFGNINNWAFLLPFDSKTTFCPPSDQLEPAQTAKDEFASGIAENTLKSWTRMAEEERISIGLRAFLSVMEIDSSIEERDRSGYFIDLMKLVVQPPFISPDDNASEEFRICRTNPLGVVGIVLVNPAKMSMTSIMLPILLTTMKGNAAIVISVSSPLSQYIMEACSSNFPVGLVNFISTSTVTDLFARLSHHEKVSLVWIVHGRGEGTLLNQIHTSPFTTFILDHQDLSRPRASLTSVARLAHSSKIIHW